MNSLNPLFNNTTTDGGIYSGFAVVANVDKLWAGLPLQLRYVFLDGGEFQRHKVREACKEWERWADVEFIEVQNKDEAQIRIGFKNNGNWSWIGNDCLKEFAQMWEQTMNFGDITDIETFGGHERGAILREFGHALGMKHEYKVPARDGEGVFYESVALFSNVDVKSVMMYHVPAQFTRSGKLEVSDNHALSELDKAYVTINYPRRSDEYADQSWSLRRALEVAKVSAEAATVILERAHIGDIQTIRKTFSEWSMSKFRAAYLQSQHSRAPANVQPANFGEEYVKALLGTMESANWLGLQNGSVPSTAVNATAASVLNGTQNFTTTVPTSGDAQWASIQANANAAQPDVDYRDTFIRSTNADAVATALQGLVGVPPTGSPMVNPANAATANPARGTFGSGVASHFTSATNEALGTAQQSASTLSAHGLGGSYAGNALVANLVNRVLGQLPSTMQYAQDYQTGLGVGVQDVLHQQVTTQIIHAAIHQLLVPAQLSYGYFPIHTNLHTTVLTDVVRDLVAKEVLGTVLKQWLIPVAPAPVPERPVTPAPPAVQPEPPAPSPVVVVPVVHIVREQVVTPTTPDIPEPVPAPEIPEVPSPVLEPVPESVAEEVPVFSPATTVSEIAVEEEPVPEPVVECLPEDVSLPTPTTTEGPLSPPPREIEIDDVVIPESPVIEAIIPESPVVEAAPPVCDCCAYHGSGHKSKPSEDKISISMMKSLVTRHEWASTGCMDAPSNAIGMDASNTYVDKLWDELPLKLCYSFIGGGEIQRRKVRDTCKEWERWSDVEFIEVKNKEDAQLRIAFENDGNWSWIGNDCLKEFAQEREQTMNLGDVHNAQCFGDQERGNILHEFGHALGMRHEHQSPARERDLLDENATLAYYMGGQYKLPKEWIRQQVLDVYNTSNMTNFHEVDSQSIMMSRLPAQVIKSGVESLQNNRLSELDKAFITINYPRRDDQYADRNWSIKRAVEVAGIPSDVAEVILERASVGDIGAVREAFSNWSLHKTEEMPIECEEAYIPVSRESGDWVWDGEHGEEVQDLAHDNQLGLYGGSEPCAPEIDSHEYEDNTVNAPEFNDEAPQAQEVFSVLQTMDANQADCVEQPPVSSPGLVETLLSPVETQTVENAEFEDMHGSPDVNAAELEPSADICDVAGTPVDENPAVSTAHEVLPEVQQPEHDTAVPGPAESSADLPEILIQEAPAQTLSTTPIDSVFVSDSLPAAPVDASLPSVAEPPRNQSSTDILSVVLQQLLGTQHPTVSSSLSSVPFSMPNTSYAHNTTTLMPLPNLHAIVQQALATAQSSRGAPGVASVARPSGDSPRFLSRDPSAHLSALLPQLADVPSPIAQSMISEAINSPVIRGTPAASASTAAQANNTFNPSTGFTVSSSDQPTTLRSSHPVIIDNSARHTSSGVVERDVSSRVPPGMWQGSTTQTANLTQARNAPASLGNAAKATTGDTTSSDGLNYLFSGGLHVLPPTLLPLTAPRHNNLYESAITQAEPVGVNGSNQETNARRVNFAPRIVTTFA